MLDRHAAVHPGLRVARLRAPAILQPAAAGELTRYLLGRLAPLVRREWLRPRVVPLPDPLVTQVVHSADVAAAIWRALRAGASGPFNIAAEPALDGDAIAAALRMHRLPVPVAVLRWLMSASAVARLQPLDASWLDLLTGSPLVSTDRARADLGWRPRHRGDRVLAAMRDAAVAGAGTASARLAPAG